MTLRPSRIRCPRANREVGQDATICASQSVPRRVGESAERQTTVFPGRQSKLRSWRQRLEILQGIDVPRLGGR
jgi:hypothetical protein